LGISVQNGISLIHREDLILAPDPCHNKCDHNHKDSGNHREVKPRSHSASAPRTAITALEKAENSEQEDEIDNPTVKIVLLI
jgi:hypothetical protein